MKGNDRTPVEFTRLMNAARDGNDEARDELWAGVYDQLRKIAHARIRRVGPDAELRSTALVHAAYLRLSGEVRPRFRNRGEFFRAAARAMRNILVEEIRKEASLKRGGNLRRVTLTGVPAVPDGGSTDVMELDLALTRLAEVHPRVAEVIQLRYFVGLTIDEAADALDVSTATVERDWSFGRTWLLREIARSRDTA